MKAALLTLFNHFKRAPKPLKYLSYALLAYGVYALILGLMVPAIIQSQAPKQLSALLGREVSIGRVTINPFLLRAQVDQFSIAEQDKQRSFASFQQLTLEVSFWRTILDLTLTIDHLNITQPKLRVVRLGTTNGASQFNFSDMLQQLATDQANEESNEQEAVEADRQLPHVRVARMAVLQGSLALRDRETATDLNYHSLNVRLSQFDSRAFTLKLPELLATDNPPQLAPNANSYSFNMTDATKGQIRIDGRFQLQPLAVAAELELSQIELVPFWPLLEKQVKAALTSGQFSFVSQFHAEQGETGFQFSTDQGQFSLVDIAFSAKEQAKLRLAHLAISDIALDSQSQGVSIHGIDAGGLWADASLNEKGLDLQQLFTPLSAEKPAKPAGENGAEIGSDNRAEKQMPWRVSVAEFTMSEADINLTEQVASEGVHWRIFPLMLQTGSLSSDLSQPIDYSLALDISSAIERAPEHSRGRLSSSGQIDATALNIEGELSLSDLELAQFQPYLSSVLNLDLNRGLLSSMGRFSVDSRGQGRYDGQVAIADLLVNDRLEREPLVKWQEMAIDLLSLDLMQRSLAIDTIRLQAPYAKVVIAKDGRTNIGELLVTEANSAAGAANDQASKPVKGSESSRTHQESAQGSTAEKASGTEAFKLEIAQIDIIDGSAYFADKSLTPNFASGIESMTGQISQLSSSPGTKAKIDVKGKIDKYAPVVLKGEVNPLIDPPYLDLDFSLAGAELTSVNPYSGTYVGYYIDKGQISLDINYRLENNKLKGRNHVVIDQLTLGKTSDSDLATSLPVSLAIALLQDSNGVIDLGVDVSGDIDNPDFSIGGIVMKAIGNVITKAVTAPFRLLANLVGSEDELNIVPFQPGISTLSEQNQQNLAKLAKGLVERPRLHIEVEGAVSPVEDNSALAEAGLHQALLKASALPELPQNFSASQVPESGPLAVALVALFSEQLGLDVAAERLAVAQRLMEADGGVTPEPTKVTEVLHIGMYNQLLKNYSVDETALSLLAEARAQAVKDYLVVEGGVPHSRIFVRDSKSGLSTDGYQVVLEMAAQ